MKKAKEKTFQSEELNRVIRSERLTWLIPAIIAIKQVDKYGDQYWESLVTDFSLFTIVGIILTILTLTLLSASIPFFIARGLFYGYKQQLIKNSSFITVQDFDYYRDKLEGLTPGAISLLTDLKIEQRKDVTASLLRYENMGILRCEDNRYFVTEKYYTSSSLRTSDRYLIDYLGQNQFDMNNDKAWQGLVEKEAIEDGYIVRKGKEKVKQNFLGCLPIIVSFVLVILFMDELVELIDKLDELSIIIESSNASLGDQMRLLLQYPQYIPLIILVFVPFVAMIRLIGLAIGSVANGQTYLDSVPKVKRTDLGNQMAEYIYGMKNFIHDFSNLSQADKEQLVLWDDYLVYAVVLEENQQIVDEILNLRTRGVM